jgi:hypothetical protein
MNSHYSSTLVPKTHIFGSTFNVQSYESNALERIFQSSIKVMVKACKEGRAILRSGIRSFSYFSDAEKRLFSLVEYSAAPAASSFSPVEL